MRTSKLPRLSPQLLHLACIAGLLFLIASPANTAATRTASRAVSEARVLAAKLNAAERKIEATPEVLRLARAYDAACRRAWGVSSVQAARCDARLAAAFHDTRHDDEAVALLARSIPRLVAAGRSQAAELARARSVYGDSLFDDAEIEPQLTAALKMQGALFGDNNIDTIHTLYRLAALEDSQGRYLAAEALTQRAWAAADRAGANNDDRARLLVQRAWQAAFADGHYSIAEQLLTDAWAFADKAYERFDERRALVLSPLGNVQRELGRFDQAEATERRFLDLYEHAYGANDPRVALALSALAMTLPANRAEEAEAFSRRVLEITKGTPDWGPNSPYTARELYRLSNYLYWRGARPEAENLADRAVAILTSLQGAQSVNLSSHLARLAEWRLEDGDAAQAAALAARALEIDRAGLRVGHPNIALAQLRLGEAQFELRKLGEAEANLREAIAQLIEVASSQNPDAGAAHAVLSATLWTEGYHDDAWAEIPAALNGLRTVPIGQTSLEHYFGWKRALTYVVGVAAARDDDAARAIAFEAMQIASNSSVASAAIRAAARLAPDRPEIAEFAQQLLSLSAQIEILERQQAAAYGQGDEVGVRTATVALVAARAQLADTQETLSQRYPKFAELSGRLTVSLDDLNGRAGGVLHPDEAVMQLLQTREHLYVMLIGPKGVRLQTVALAQAEAEKVVAALRDGLRIDNALTPADLPNYDLVAAHDLYRRIIAPLRRELRHVKTLYVVPDGALARLPFALLVTREGSGRDMFERYRNTRWLGDQLALVTLPSPAVLVVSRQIVHASRASEPFIAFADPNLSGTQDISTLTALANLRGESDGATFAARTASVVCRMRPLPDTRREAEALAAQLHASADSLFLGADASETALYELSASGRLGRARVVLFATHGLVASEQPGFSEPALVLTPAKSCAPTSDAEDGLLTAGEIATLRLDADWVILSGCNTASNAGAGDATPLSGLARAFLYGGARRVLVSHWSVDSDTTADLMAATFRAFSSGVNAARALAEAMHQIRMQDGPLRYRSHPAFWAAFAIVGDTAPLSSH